ncbi:unnamed protein product [Heterosigma akashiwo]
MGWVRAGTTAAGAPGKPARRGEFHHGSNCPVTGCEPARAISSTSWASQRVKRVGRPLPSAAIASFASSLRWRSEALRAIVLNSCTPSASTTSPWCSARPASISANEGHSPFLWPAAA